MSLDVLIDINPTLQLTTDAQTERCLTGTRCARLRLAWLHAT